ncbi:MAG: acyl-[Lachnospiraceae bacterium]|nr:acyl-[acyl-carrier-protein] thioesterase [Lachnospiraceae bacterium]
MYYTFDGKIRYSETDSEGRLTLAALLNYFQDCSTFQSEMLGLGVKYMKEHRLVWVLSSWQIVVERYPMLCEDVQIGTFPYDFKSFMGGRNFFMKDKEGKYVAKANSLWSLLNTQTMKPVAAPEDMVERYGLDPKLEMDYVSRKIAVPEGGLQGETVIVKKHHLDTNHHVNNGQYVAMALDCLPEGAVAKQGIRQLRAEYKKQAFLGDKLYPYIVETEDGMIVSLRSEEGKPYVNVEFK